jgi:hypothetical protein
MADDEDRPAPPPSDRFATLPPHVTAEDLVEETDASTPPYEPSSDPNRDVATHWGGA